MAMSFARIALVAAIAALAVDAAPQLGRGAQAQVIAWTQRSVPIGRVSVNHHWRCSTKQGDTVYFATDYTEAAARARLESYVGYRVSCTKEDVLPFGMGFRF